MDEALKFAKAISKEHDKFTIIILIISGVVYFIVNIIVNLIIPVILSHFNKKNEIRKIRSERKLDSAESVIKQLRLLSSYFLGFTDAKNMSEGKMKINNLREYVYSNDLLLSEELSCLANNLLDYYSDVLVSPENKNADSENKIFIKMKKAYEEIL